MTHTPSLTRTARLLLAAAILRGILSGAARAIITCLLDHDIHCAYRVGESSPIRARRTILMGGKPCFMKSL